MPGEGLHSRAGFLIIYTCHETSVWSICCSLRERKREPLEKLTELQKGVMSCADWHLQTQILKVDEKSDPDMTKSRGYNEDEARAAPKCWMDVEKFSEV